VPALRLHRWVGADFPRDVMHQWMRLSGSTRASGIPVDRYLRTASVRPTERSLRITLRSFGAQNHRWLGVDGQPVAFRV
jgi:hypothetical protein